MRVGLVGVGRFGRRYLQTLATLSHLELVAVASRNPDSRALLAQGCRLYPDWRDLLRVEALDGLLVVTPPASHAAIVTAAVERGLAVLVEKPLTLDLAEAEALLALPRRAPVMVEHTHLFSPAYAALRARARGQVGSIEVAAGADGPLRSDASVLWDWGAHWVAVCLDLLDGAPRRCRCLLDEERRSAEGIGQSVSLELDFGTVTATMRLSNLLQAPRRRLQVRTTTGECLVYDELAAAPFSVLDAAGVTRSVPVSGERPLAVALACFHDTWRRWRDGDRGEPVSGLALGVEVVRTLARCDAALARP